MEGCPHRSIPVLALWRSRLALFHFLDTKDANQTSFINKPINPSYHNHGLAVQIGQLTIQSTDCAAKNTKQTQLLNKHNDVNTQSGAGICI